MNKKRVNKAEKALTGGEGGSVLLSEETVVYCVDTSGSMEGRLEYGTGVADDDTKLARSMSKRAAVVYAMRAMLNARQGYANADRLGVVTFGGGGGRAYATTKIKPSVVKASHFEVIKDIGADGNTPMFQGLKQAAEELKDAEGLVRILLISDGEPNAGYTKHEIRALVSEMHEDYGFVIDCLGIGIPGKTGDYDEDFLKDLATLGGGEFYPVESVDQLIKKLVHMVRERQLFIGGGIKLLAAN